MNPKAPSWETPHKAFTFSLNHPALTSRVVLFWSRERRGSTKRHQIHRADLITRTSERAPFCCSSYPHSDQRGTHELEPSIHFSQSPIFFLCTFISSPGSVPEAAQRRAAWPRAHRFPVRPWHLHPQLRHSWLLQEKAGIPCAWSRLARLTRKLNGNERRISSVSKHGGKTDHESRDSTDDGVNVGFIKC